MQGCASLPRTNDRKLVLIVIDGLTPSVFEHAAESGDTPALSYLARHGTYGRALSTFPSLTPVCASSIATGTHPDVHRIPHLVWYHRDEQRLIEYGSSFGALKAAGTRRSIIDTIFHMNGRHLGSGATTLFEALDDAGLVTAAINFTCYRGRTEHRTTLPGVVRRTRGPRRFFYYSLFESDETGAPLAVRNRAAGSIDEYATAVGRWLVTRDGFDFLLFYLSDYDYASHALGPEGAAVKLGDADRAVGALLEAAGGPDEFLERYDVLLCSDHGQTTVDQAAPLESAYSDLRIFRGRQLRGDVAVCASNRAGQVYRLPGCNEDVRRLAERLDGHEAVDTVLFREDGDAVARRDREELRFRRDNGGFALAGDRSLLDDHPDALTRAWAALANPNAGDVLVSAAAGYEFTDLGGRHHAGGGSHGSLCTGDSEVPMLAIGPPAPPSSITEIAPTVLAQLGVR
jgi:Type I phosphodiesterase / nucleotide pyrophosphatase